MENIPQETETIAVKRSVRLAEKLRDARRSIIKTDSWWNSSYMEAVLVSAVFILNFYTVYTYFGTASVENVFYSGPVIPALAKLLEWGSVDLNYALQLINLLFILFLPITFYLLVKKITDRKNIALLAILISSLPFYPFAAVRVHHSLAGVDGAHISSLTVSMVALVGLFSFIKTGGARNLIFASIMASIVALMSPFGFTTFFIMASILTFSEMLLGLGRMKIFRFLVVMLFVVMLVAFWYNPHFAFWLLTGSLGEEVRRTVSKLLPISFFALPTLGAFGYLLFDRKPSLQTVFLASFFTIAFSLISLAGGGVVPSHPSRYVAELGISVSLFLSVVLVKLFESLKFFENKKMYVRLVIILVYVGLSTAILLGNKNVVYNNQVLGLWTGVEKGTIWQEREKFGGMSAVSGYLITLLGIGALSYIFVYSGKQNSMTIEGKQKLPTTIR